jgi:site-specific DNA-methyltransferase (adenine-specific)
MTPYTLHNGDALDTMRSLGDGAVSAVVCDPPYSERTHSGHDAVDGGHLGAGFDGCQRQKLTYSAWTPDDARASVREMCRVSAGWVVVLTDHVLAPVIADEMEACGRYAFAPVPYVAPGSRVRLSGDGPSSWTVYLSVSRPKHEPFTTWGTLPGAYIRKPGWDRPVYIGGKPVQLMTLILRDYSRPGDLVLDPYMGSGTTGVAAVRMGRRFAGVERDADAYAFAKRRIGHEFGQTLPMGGAKC